MQDEDLKRITWARPHDLPGVMITLQNLTNVYDNCGHMNLSESLNQQESWHKFQKFSQNTT